MTHPSPLVGILDRLVDVRRRRNWSQADMAGYLAITEEAYRALEKGRTIRLEWKTILRLWDVLENSGLSLHWLCARPEIQATIALPRFEDKPGMSPVVAILDRLVEVRRLRRWSQGEMAAYLAVTEEAYRALEKGRTIRLEWSTLLRLWDILENTGLSMQWLLERPKPAVPAPPAVKPDDNHPLPPPVSVAPQKRRKRGFRLAGAEAAT